MKFLTLLSFLMWSPNTEADLAGYKVYWGNQSKQYQFFAATSDTFFPVEKEPRFYAVTALDHGGHESAFSNEVFSPGQQGAPIDSVIFWSDRKPIKLVLHYEKLDTMGFPIEPTFRPQWIQTSTFWPGEWRDLLQANGDFTVAGDTLTLNTIRLSGFNPGNIHRWKFRVKLVTPQGESANWREAPAAIQPQTGTRGVPRDVIKIELK